MKKPKFNLTREEEKIFRKLNSPSKIQDFINSIPINFEKSGDTAFSPRTVLKKRKAHCLEGALLASAIIWYHGGRPLILDLKSTNEDFDHVIAIFKKNQLWGAISKTNHAVLRYREPIYKTIRELVMSYFHEYYNEFGNKTLRSYSKVFSLKKYGVGWIVEKDHLYHIGADLDDARHIAILPKSAIKNLRKADSIEIKSGLITQYK